MRRMGYRFNAARGFVGGATKNLNLNIEPNTVSMPHAALWVVQPVFQYGLCVLCWFQCRTRLCGWCNIIMKIIKTSLTVFQCRTRLCGWCNSWSLNKSNSVYAFQCRTRLCGWCNRHKCRDARWLCSVSMPHAALWVVQPHRSQPLSP